MISALFMMGRFVNQNLKNRNVLILNKISIEIYKLN